jgi:AcrR family transcriptional regulator
MNLVGDKIQIFSYSFLAGMRPNFQILTSTRLSLSIQLMAAKRPAQKTKTYHHGDLREALLRSAESILKREGLGALTLRAAARTAGVSHAAPAHHFPDLSSLLSALAAEGFDQLAGKLTEAANKEGDTTLELAHAYIGFAKANPALFQLMSDPSRLDSKNSTLQAARRRAISVLAGTSGANMENPTLSQVGAMTANWAQVHGLSLLLLSGRLGTLVRIAPEGTTEMQLVESAIQSMKRST